MEVPEKKLLTDEQAWNDLQSVSYTRTTAGPAVAMCALPIVSMLAVCVGLIIPGIVFLVVTIIVAPMVFKKPAVPVWNPKDPNVLIYDMDVCIDRHERLDSDCDVYYEVTFAKAGYVRNAGMFTEGYPSGNDTQIGDRFYTVTLRDNPKAIKYYSMKEWYLGEPEPDEELPESC